MANEQNLRPSEYKFTDEDRKKATRVRQENLKKRKTFAQAFDAYLSSQFKQADGTVLSGTELIAKTVIDRANEGDLKAFELIRDTVGEKPIDKVAKVEISQDIRDKVEALVEEYGQKSGN